MSEGREGVGVDCAAHGAVMLWGLVVGHYEPDHVVDGFGAGFCVPAGPDPLSGESERMVRRRQSVTVIGIGVRDDYLAAGCPNKRWRPEDRREDVF